MGWSVDRIYADRGRLAALPLLLDECFHRLRVPVGVLLALQVVATEPADEVFRLGYTGTDVFTGSTVPSAR